MTWRCEEHLAAAALLNRKQRNAFQAGYSDGFLLYPRGHGGDQAECPSSYGHGFDAGRRDRNEHVAVDDFAERFAAARAERLAEPVTELPKRRSFFGWLKLPWKG